MKKLFLVPVFVALMFVFPMYGNAAPIGDVLMSGTWDYPLHSVANDDNQDGGHAYWSLNYSVSFDGSTLVPYNTLGDYEAFCTQVFLDIYGTPTPYSLYTINAAQLTTLGLASDRYLAAAWIAENYGMTSQKAAAQLAMWEILEDGIQFDLTAGVFYAQELNNQGEIDHEVAEDIYDALIASDLTGYVPSASWVLAVSTSSVPGQNMIVQNPVPEPATMLLFGSGLLGLAVLGRKSFLK